MVNFITTGGLTGLLLLVGVDLTSFVVAVAATRLLDDVELEYRPWIIRCFMHTTQRKRTTSHGEDDEPSSR